MRSPSWTEQSVFCSFEMCIRDSVKAERRITTLTERGEMWEQYNQYKSIHKQLAKVKPEKREQFEQRHSRELILYDAATRYLKELKDSGEAITPKTWQREIDQLAAGKQTDTLAMKSMREDLKAVERLRKMCIRDSPLTVKVSFIFCGSVWKFLC